MSADKLTPTVLSGIVSLRRSVATVAIPAIKVEVACIVVRTPIFGIASLHSQ